MMRVRTYPDNRHDRDGLERFTELHWGCRGREEVTLQPRPRAVLEIPTVKHYDRP